MTWLPAAAAIGGSILGAYGNASVANRQNRAVQAQNTWMNNEFAGYLPQSALLGLGPDAYRYLAGTQGRDTLNTAISVSGEDRARLEREAADLEAQMGNLRNTYRGGGGFKGVVGRGGSDIGIDPRYKNLESRLASVRAQLADDSQKINKDDYEALAASGISPVDKMQGIADTYVAGNQAVSDRFEADASNTRRLLDNYGKSETERINRDSARDLVGTQCATRSTLSRGGMGLSSMAASAYSANANRAGEARNNALGQVADRTAQLKANLATSQSAQRTALGLSNASSQYQANQGVQGTRLGLITGPEFTPWLNRAAPNMPSASAGGAAAQTFGNSLSAMGGLYGMANMQGGSAQSNFAIDQSYMPGSTIYAGSNRPR